MPAYVPSRITSKNADAYQPPASSTAYSNIEYKPNSQKSVDVNDQYMPIKNDNLPSVDYTPSGSLNFLEQGYSPTVRVQSKTTAKNTDPYQPSASSTTYSNIDYKPNSQKSVDVNEQYMPTKSDNLPSVDYTPSGNLNFPEPGYSPTVTSDYSPAVALNEPAYVPSGNLNFPEPGYSPTVEGTATSGVDYSPTKALNTKEPAYTPSYGGADNSFGICYMPSAKNFLQEEPTYSPASNSKTSGEVVYVPGSAGDPFSLEPESYLAMLEGNAEEEENGDKTKKEDEKAKEKKREKRSDKRSSSSSSSKSKSRDRERREKEKKREREKEKSERREDDKKKRKREEKETTRKEESEESDVDEECYRIFKEYQPPEPSDADQRKAKKRLDEPSSEPVDETFIPLKKQRIAHGSSDSGHIKRIATAPPLKPSKLSPSMVMLERFKKLQESRTVPLTKPSTVVASPTVSLSSSSSTVSLSLSSSSTSLALSAVASSGKKRIAHVPNVLGLLTPRPRTATVSSASSATSSLAAASSRSSASSAKPGNSATAKAAPRQTTLPRPVIAIEYGSRVPASVRQRYLNIFVDEFLKIYDQEQDAYDRAVSEESQCYARSSNKTVYLNVVVNNVNRIRREAESGGGVVRVPEANHQAEGRVVVSHSSVLAGKGGAKVSWSIEKPRAKIDASRLDGATLYKLLERYLLTSEQLESNGYPLPDPTEKGKALINMQNSFRPKSNAATPKLATNQRQCDRCKAVYQIDMKGHPVKMEDQCVYHWGRLFQRRGESRYSCCQGDSNSEGCSVGKCHVTDTFDPENTRGYVSTLAKSPPPDGNYGVFALDCEMSYTTVGPELTRVTVVDSDMKTVYETLVKPDNPILDYNTRFSGITEEDLKGVRTKLRDVQAVLLSKFSNKTILIGHSFDSDLRALKMIHTSVVDTSIVFPHPRGPPYKRALRTLSAEVLQKIIQNGVDGHDSAEDAIACMELMLWKVKQDLKLLK
nr:EOG090X01LQ [Eulimnadia texana]